MNCLDLRPVQGWSYTYFTYENAIDSLQNTFETKRAHPTVTHKKRDHTTITKKHYDSKCQNTRVYKWIATSSVPQRGFIPVAKSTYQLTLCRRATADLCNTRRKLLAYRIIISKKNIVHRKWRRLKHVIFLHLFTVVFRGSKIVQNVNSY